MTIRIGSNIASLNAQRHLDVATQKSSKVFEKLSSGLRINSASDDAAGLAISSNLKFSSRVYTQGVRNLSDGISALNIASGALSALAEVVTRQMELSEQAANGVYDLSTRRSMHQEANALTEEFNRIVSTTKFNEQSLLNGDLSSLRLQAGIGELESLSIGIGSELQRVVGSGTFQASISLGVSASVGHFSAVSGDIDNDGDIDIISAPNGSEYQVLLNNGDGTFALGATISAGLGASGLLPSAIGDLNNDGNLDFVFGGNTANTLVAFIGNGSGGFTQSQSFATAQMTGVAIGDIDNDGINDIAYTNSTTDALQYAFGHGDGTFTSFVSTGDIIAGAGTFVGISIADINNDGSNELVTSGLYASQVRVYSGVTRTGFSSVSTTTIGLYNPRPELADFNGDGYLDIVGSNGGSSVYHIALGRADGSFGTSTSYVTETNGQGYLARDINGDGNSDIVFAGTLNTSVLIGNGDGTFKAAITSAAPLAGALAFLVEDFNKDGAYDVIAGQTPAGKLGIYFGDSTTTTNAEKLYLLTQEGALSALEKTRSTLQRISEELGVIGSHQSRVNVAKNVLSVTRENYDSAASRILDSDIATDAAELARTRIQQQAAVAILSQANLLPEISLKLLDG